MKLIDKLKLLQGTYTPRPEDIDQMRVILDKVNKSRALRGKLPVSIPSIPKTQEQVLQEKPWLKPGETPSAWEYIKRGAKEVLTHPIKVLESARQSTPSQVPSAPKSALSFFPGELARTVFPVIGDIEKMPSTEPLLQEPLALQRERIIKAMPGAIKETAQQVGRFVFALPIEFGLDVVDAIKQLGGGKPIKELDTKILGKVRPYSTNLIERQAQGRAVAESMGVKNETTKSALGAFIPFITEDIFRAVATAGTYGKIGLTTGQLIKYKKITTVIYKDAGNELDFSKVAKPQPKISEYVFGKTKKVEVPFRDVKGREGLVVASKVNGGKDAKFELYGPRDYQPPQTVVPTEQPTGTVVPTGTVPIPRPVTPIPPIITRPVSGIVSPAVKPVTEPTPITPPITPLTPQQKVQQKVQEINTKIARIKDNLIKIEGVKTSSPRTYVSQKLSVLADGQKKILDYLNKQLKELTPVPAKPAVKPAPIVKPAATVPDDNTKITINPPFDRPYQTTIGEAKKELKELLDSSTYMGEDGADEQAEVSGDIEAIKKALDDAMKVKPAVKPSPKPAPTPKIGVSRGISPEKGVIPQLRTKALSRGVIKDVILTDKKINKLDAPVGTNVGERTIYVNKVRLQQNIDKLLADKFQELKRQPNESDSHLIGRYLDDIVKFEESHIKNATVGQAIVLEKGGMKAREVAKKLDELAVTQRSLTEPKRGEVAKAEVKPEGEIITHTSEETFPTGKPNFDAYFGDKEFIKEYPNVRGEKQYNVILPKNIKILDFNTHSPEVRSFENELLKSNKVLREYFYKDIWSVKKIMMPFVKEKGYEGTKFGGEYLLSKETIEKLQVVEPKRGVGRPRVREEKPKRPVGRPVTGEITLKGALKAQTERKALIKMTRKVEQPTTPVKAETIGKLKRFISELERKKIITDAEKARLNSKTENIINARTLPPKSTWRKMTPEEMKQYGITEEKMIEAKPEERKAPAEKAALTRIQVAADNYKTELMSLKRAGKDIGYFTNLYETEFTKEIVEDKRNIEGFTGKGVFSKSEVIKDFALNEFKDTTPPSGSRLGRIFNQQRPRPAGEIGEQILGGQVKVEAARIRSEIGPIRQILENVFPYFKTKRLEKMIGREVMNQLPDDVGSIMALLYKFTPRRVQFAKNPLASEMIARTIRTQIDLEAEKGVLNDKVTEIESKFNGKKGEYEQLTDYIEMGFTDEDLAKLPSKYEETMIELRKLESAKLDLIIRELKIDTSKWRFTPENYLHHMWRGQWEIYSALQNKRLFMGNLKTSLDFFEKYWIKNPKTDIVIRPRNIQTNFTSVQLSQKGFWMFVSRVAKAMEINPKDILDDVAFKGIASIEKKRVFIGAFRPRLANLGGYLKDPFLVERIVWNKLLRKKYIEPLSKWARSQLSKLPEQIRIDMKKYLTKVEKSGFDEPSFWGWRKAISALTKISANIKLGWRIPSALVNRIQDVQFTLPDVGFKTWLKGQALAHSREGRELINKSNVLVAPIKYETGEWKPQRKVAWWKPLKLFDISERKVRGECLMERFLEGFERFDYNEVNKNFEKYGIKKNYLNQEDMALDYAIRQMSGDMGIYNYTDFPAVMTAHPIMRIPFQFKFLPILWIDKAMRVSTGRPTAGTEIFFETNPYTNSEKYARFFRFWLINLLFSGVKIFELLLRWIAPTTLAYALLKQPTWMRGIFAAIGLDVSPSFSADPFTLLDINKTWWEIFGGPYGSDIKTSINSVQNRNWKNLLSISPAIQRIVAAIMANDGIVTNFYTDIPQAKLSTYERIMIGIGFTPMTLTKARDLSFVIVTLKNDYYDTNKLVKRAWDDGDDSKAKSIKDEWNAKMNEWTPLIYERMGEILKRDLTYSEKVKIKNRFYVDSEDFKTWKSNWRKGIKEEPFAIEKQLGL